MSYHTPAHSPAISDLRIRLEALLKEGAANVRAGRPGIISVPESPIGAEYRVTYERWMNLRALAGDQFALSLGYGRTNTGEAT